MILKINSESIYLHTCTYLVIRLHKEMELGMIELFLDSVNDFALCVCYLMPRTE